MLDFNILIDNKEFSYNDMEQWSRKHTIKAFKKLDIPYNKKLDTLSLIKLLTDEKINMGYEQTFKKLRNQLYLGNVGMKLLSLLSFNKRKIAKIIIKAKGIDVYKLGEIIDFLMMSNSIDTQFINLSACPEHYALRFNNNILEVIEATGNSPIPTQFFISFNDETGIITPRDNSYPYQSVGVAKLKDGTIIGGVRHQFKNIEQGIEAVLLVEFPSLTPRSLIKEHQKHLAIEWSNWINWAIQ